jgi:hypothetical protein
LDDISRLKESPLENLTTTYKKLMKWGSILP